MLAPRSGKSFGIAWDLDSNPWLGAQSPKKLLVWEPEPDGDGGRWAWCVQPNAFSACEYLMENEILKLFQQLGAPTIIVLPPTGAEKQLEQSK